MDSQSAGVAGVAGRGRDAPASAVTSEQQLGTQTALAWRESTSGPILTMDRRPSAVLATVVAGH
jgi:hypothetical protein